MALASVAGSLAIAGGGRAVAGEGATPVTGAVTLAVEGVTVLDGTGAAPQLSATVLVSGEKIEAVLDRPTPLAAGTPVIDGGGLTLLPGLVDTHVHWQSWMSPLFLRFGVTTVRDVGSATGRALWERDRERRGEVVGPRMVVHGPLLDGFPPTPTSAGNRTLRSPEQAIEAAETLIEREGVDGLKVYAALPPDLVGAVTEVAWAHGVPVAAHLWETSAREAAALGIRSLEHLYATAVRETPETYPSVAPFLVDRGVFASPTLLFQTSPQASWPIWCSWRAIRARTSAPRGTFEWS